MGVPAADDPEASSDDDEELEALLRRDALKAVAANDTSGKFQVAAEDEGTIATGNTVYAIATKKGGLARDHLAEVVSKITKNGQVFLTYMDKTEEQEEVKSVARIMASAVTASLLLQAKQDIGVRFLNEEEAKKDPAFAARLEGTTIISLRTTPKGFVVSNKRHLKYLATKLCDGILHSQS